MDVYTLIVAGFSFIIGVIVVSLIWIIQAAVRKARGNSKSTAKVDKNLTEVASLWRDTRTQDLVVEMEGTTFNAAHELSPAQQHRLSFTSNVLTRWLAVPAPSPASVDQTTSPPTEYSLPEFPPAPADSIFPEFLRTPASADETVTPPTEALLPEFPPVPVDSILPEFLLTPMDVASAEPAPEFVPPFTLEPDSEIKPVSTDLPDLVGGIINPAPQPPPTFKSIATQINDILQAQLEGTELAPRGISLTDAPDHGVTVTVDGEKYLGVKDVPDEEVRKAIRAAVLEWEKKK